MAYMDDVVISSNTFEDHLEQINIVLEKVEKAGLTINPKKVQLATNQVDLLGFVVDDGKLRPNDAKFRAIAEYPCPHDVKCLQRFLGMIAFYRGFIPNCAELTRPHNQLLRNRVKWHWDAAAPISFDALSKAIVQTAALYFQDLNRHFVLQTDASYYGLGAVRLQEFDGALRPVAFAVPN